MKNLLKVLIASAVMLGALGSSSVKPALAQTPTPSPQWRVTLTVVSGPHDGNGQYGIPVGTPPNYYNANPPAGKNGLSWGGFSSTTVAPSPTPYRNDFDIVATFQWDGAGSPPSSINIQEELATEAAAIPGIDDPPPGGYGQAIEYIASLSSLPTGVTPTIQTTDTSKSTSVQFTAYNVPVDSTGKATVTRHITSHLIVDWSKEPQMAERPGRYSTTWDYEVGLVP